MTKAKEIILKISSLLPALALMMGIIAANSACTSFYHQPETPDAMNEYRK